MNAPRDASYDGYLTDVLKVPSEAVAHVEAVMELDDPAALLAVLCRLFCCHDRR